MACVLRLVRFDVTKFGLIRSRRDCTKVLSKYRYTSSNDDLRIISDACGELQTLKTFHFQEIRNLSLSLSLSASEIEIERVTGSPASSSHIFTLKTTTPTKFSGLNLLCKVTRPIQVAFP